jgi:hypothetical protein
VHGPGQLTASRTPSRHQVAALGLECSVVARARCFHTHAHTRGCPSMQHYEVPKLWREGTEAVREEGHTYSRRALHEALTTRLTLIGSGGAVTLVRAVRRRRARSSSAVGVSNANYMEGPSGCPWSHNNTRTRWPRNLLAPVNTALLNLIGRGGSRGRTIHAIGAVRSSRRSL